MRLVVLLLAVLTATGLAWPLADAAAEGSQAKPGSAAASITPATDCNTRFRDEDWDQRVRGFLDRTPRLLPSDWRARIVVPPPPDCATSHREIEALFQLLPLRAARQAEIDAEAVWGSGIAAYQRELTVDLKQHPYLEALIDLVMQEALQVVAHFKNKFKRPRPWQLEPRLTLAIPPPMHGSYPSGHATEFHAAAFALARLAPECREHVLNFAGKVARNREIAGVHYASDTVAGRNLAERMMEIVFAAEPYRNFETYVVDELGGKSICRQQ